MFSNFGANEKNLMMQFILLYFTVNVTVHQNHEVQLKQK